MSVSQRPSRLSLVIGLTLIAIVSASILTVTAAGADAPRFGFIDEVKQFFGLKPTQTSALIAQPEESNSAPAVESLGPLADAAGAYRSAATGNWSTNATWERFDGASWVAAVATPTSADGVITIRNSHVVTITATVTYDQVLVDAGGQVTVAATITHTLANGTGTDLTINGLWRNMEKRSR